MAGHPVRRLDFDPLNKSVQVVSPNEIKTGILELPAIGAMWEAWLLVERGFLKSKIGPIMCRCSTPPREKRWTASKSSLRRTVSPPSGTTLLIIVRRTNKWKPGGGQMVIAVTRLWAAKNKLKAGGMTNLDGSIDGSVQRSARKPQCFKSHVGIKKRP